MIGLFSEAKAEFGVIDILVNNAAINVQGSIFDYDPDDWDNVINVDLTAAWYLMRMVVGDMRDRGWGLDRQHHVGCRLPGWQRAGRSVRGGEGRPPRPDPGGCHRGRARTGSGATRWLPG